MTEYYVLRNKKSGHYSTGCGTNATPKLYTLGHAKRVASIKTRQGDGVYEVIPAHITFGEPVKV